MQISCNNQVFEKMNSLLDFKFGGNLISELGSNILWLGSKEDLARFARRLPWRKFVRYLTMPPKVLINSVLSFSVVDSFVVYGTE